MKITPNRAIEIFDLTAHDLTFNGLSPYKANIKLEELKGIVKKRYRKLALKLHPDHGGDEEAFKELQVAYEGMMSAKVLVQRPRPVNVYYYSYSTSTSSTASTTGYSYYG